MRKFTLLLTTLLLGGISLKAQTVATFDTLSLPGTDTCYINYSHPGTDVGFSDGLAYFPCVYDTGFGSSYWGYGFAYSNKSDSVTSGYGNQYAAKTLSGFGGTGKYAVAYGESNMIKLTGIAMGEPVSGFYITNSTYTYNSMRDGDAFAKKFGGTTGNDPDWLKLMVKGYHGGVLSTDSVEFYLADYRFAHNDSDYLVRTWQWVNLLPLGHLDSLKLTLSSSDTNSYGINTPAYYCIDNFTTHESSLSVGSLQSTAIVAYPNPVTDVLHVALPGNEPTQINVVDVFGKSVYTANSLGGNINISTSSFAPGVYILKTNSSSGGSTVRFIKE